MKVLHVLTSHIFSGAENVVCQIISMFADMPDVEMAYCSPDGTIRPALKERDIQFYPVKKANIAEIKRVISEYKPDVIHAHDMRASFLASFSCGSIPLISHIHNNAIDSRGISPKSLAYIYAAKKAKSIIWVSNGAYEGYKYRSVIEGKSQVLVNVLDTAEIEHRLSMDANTYNYDVVYVGRLAYPKNVQRLIQIGKLVADKCPDFKLGIVGTGEDEPELKAMVTELGLTRNVDFLGFMANPLKVVKDAKLLALTSLWEGTPMCALEAMVIGTPIISVPTDVKALITDGYNGYIADTDEEFAEKVIKTLQSKELQEQLRANQLTCSKEYNNVEKYKAALCQLYGI